MSEVQYDIIQGQTPREIVAFPNRFIRDNFEGTDLYLTSTTATIDLRNAQVTWCCAGHPCGWGPGDLGALQFVKHTTKRKAEYRVIVKHGAPMPPSGCGAGLSAGTATNKGGGVCKSNDLRSF